MGNRQAMAGVLALGMGSLLGLQTAVGTERYVSPSGTETPPYTNWSAAAKTIQLAVNVSSNGDTVWVTNGTYGVTSEVRVTNGVTVASVNGANVTIIRAVNATNSGIRCVFISASNAVVRGFTIRDGLARWGADGGGVAILTSGMVADCVIFNCGGDGGGGAFIHAGGTIRNCLIYGCWGAIGGGVHLYSGGTVENCTIVSNDSPIGAGVSFNSGGDYKVVNSVVYGNTGSDNVGYYHTTVAKLYYSCFTPFIPGAGNMTNDPLLEAGFRLSAESPCVDRGSNQTWMVDADDLAGNARIARGSVDMGAYERKGSCGIKVEICRRLSPATARHISPN